MCPARQGPQRRQRPLQRQAWTPCRCAPRGAMGTSPRRQSPEWRVPATRVAATWCWATVVSRRGARHPQLPPPRCPPSQPSPAWRWLRMRRDGRVGVGGVASRPPPPPHHHPAGSQHVPLPGAHRLLALAASDPVPSLNEPNSLSSPAARPPTATDEPAAPRIRGVVKVRRGPVALLTPLPPPPPSSQWAGMAAAVARYCVRTCCTSAAVATSGRMTMPYRNSASSTADGSASLNMACSDAEEGNTRPCPAPTATPLEKEPNPADRKPGEPGAGAPAADEKEPRCAPPPPPAAAAPAPPRSAAAGSEAPTAAASPDGEGVGNAAGTPVTGVAIDKPARGKQERGAGWWRARRAA
jgi:hypothetical protein